MPSSGSTTSRMASSMSSMVGRSVASVMRSSSPLAATAWAVASFHAIQPSSAHLTRAGYFETPANATASSSTSSSGSTLPLDCISRRNSSCTATRLLDRLADHQVGQHGGRRPG